MRILLGIFAVVLAAGLFTATQAEAAPSQCDLDIEMRVMGQGYYLKAPKSPERTYTNEAGQCVLEFETTMFKGIREVRLYHEGTVFFRQDDVPRPNQGYDYTITLTLGLVPEVEINAERYLVWGGIKIGYHYLHSGYEHPYLHPDCIDAGGVGPECVARTIIKD